MCVVWTLRRLKWFEIWMQCRFLDRLIVIWNCHRRYKWLRDSLSDQQLSLWGTVLSFCLFTFSNVWNVYMNICKFYNHFGSLSGFWKILYLIYHENAILKKLIGVGSDFLRDFLANFWTDFLGRILTDFLKYLLIDLFARSLFKKNFQACSILVLLLL